MRTHFHSPMQVEDINCPQLSPESQRVNLVPRLSQGLRDSAHSVEANQYTRQDRTKQRERVIFCGHLPPEACNRRISTLPTAPVIKPCLLLTCHCLNNIGHCHSRRLSVDEPIVIQTGYIFSAACIETSR